MKSIIKKERNTIIGTDFIDYAKLCDGEGSFTVQIPRISVSLGWKSLGGGKLLDFLME